MTQSERESEGAESLSGFSGSASFFGLCILGLAVCVLIESGSFSAFLTVSLLSVGCFAVSAVCESLLKIDEAEDHRFVFETTLRTQEGMRVSANLSLTVSALLMSSAQRADLEGIAKRCMHVCSRNLRIFEPYRQPAFDQLVHNEIEAEIGARWDSALRLVDSPVVVVDYGALLADTVEAELRARLIAAMRNQGLKALGIAAGKETTKVVGRLHAA